jgi:cytochrome b561
MNRNDTLKRVPLVYSSTARKFHWWTVAFVLVLLTLGSIMKDRTTDKMVMINGKLTEVKAIWDATTNALFSSHKLIGFIFLFVIAGRLIYRLRNGAPPDEPSLETWQKIASHATHWALYALLIGVPLGGWIGVQLYPSANVFGLFNLPTFLTPNQTLAETVFMYHGIGAKLIFALMLVHIGAALYHHFMRKDNVLRRMLPRKEDR